MDVKVGSGAFLPERAQARALARTLIALGKRLGLPVRALLTDMDQPLGDAIGNAAEVRESIDVLRGGGPADVRALTVRLGAEMLVLGRVARDRHDGARRIEAAIASGAGLERFRLGVRLQGGDPRAIDDPRRLPRARHARRRARGQGRRRHARRRRPARAGRDAAGRGPAAQGGPHRAGRRDPAPRQGRHARCPAATGWPPSNSMTPTARAPPARYRPGFMIGARGRLARGRARSYWKRWAMAPHPNPRQSDRARRAFPLPLGRGLGEGPASSLAFACALFLRRMRRPHPKRRRERRHPTPRR